MVGLIKVAPFFQITAQTTQVSRLDCDKAVGISMEMGYQMKWTPMQMEME